MVWWDTLLLLHLRHQIRNKSRGFHLESEGLASKGPHNYLKFFPGARFANTLCSCIGCEQRSLLVALALESLINLMCVHLRVCPIRGEINF